MHVFLYCVKFGYLIGRLFGNSCSLGLRYGLVIFKYMIVNLVFSHLRFWGANFFLNAPFPDHCILSNLSQDEYFN